MGQMSGSEYILLPYGYTLRLTDGEDGQIIASCPQLPGCHAQGESVEAALDNITDAVIGYLALLEDENRAIPVADASDAPQFPISENATSDDDEMVWEVALTA